jgi:predicted TIM-barrel fold metal-dependent hydrolase
MTLNPQPSAGRIDVQFHFSPAFYTDMVKQTTHISTDRWGVENALAYMDKNHVAAGVLSVSTPSVNFLPPPESVVLARRLNEAAAEVATSNPGRFGNFATLPMLDVPATLKEIDYCLDRLRMDGVCMMSNVGGVYLGDESFAPIFDELNRRKAVIFIHPHDPADYGQLKMAPVVEWPVDTCRAAIDLIYSGTIRRCPNIRIILAHAGGALPAVARRVEEMSALYSTAEPRVMMNEAITQIAGFYYDLAIAAHENAIGALRAVSSLDHVLFACDWPFAPDPAVAMNVKGFEALKLSPEDRYSIERGNAVRLFPRLLGIADQRNIS